MLNNKTVAVIVPCYNEASQISMVIDTMPDFVDRIIVINDASLDKTSDAVLNYLTQSQNTGIYIKKLSINLKRNHYNNAEFIVLEIQEKESKKFVSSTVINKTPENDRIILIEHNKNSGKGAGISTGYKWARDYGIDCIASMDGDGQMDPEELIDICLPIINDEIDYVKGNRLIHRSASWVIPKKRFLGNSVLSILTKIASGYWHISDTQTGYNAISKKALKSLNLYDIYPRYGYPNDILVKLNIAFCTIKEVEIKPVYNVGEQSKMKIFKVIPTILWLLIKSFFKRLWIKYLFKDFHPLFLLYNFSFTLIVFVFIYGIKILLITLQGEQVNPVTLLFFSLLFISSFQALFFAMWMDIQDNERLYKS